VSPTKFILDSPPVHLKMSAVDKQLIDTLCDEKPGQNLDHLVKMKKMKMIDLFEEIGNIFDEQLRSNFEGNRRTSLSNFRIDRTGLPRLGKIPKNPMDEVRQTRQIGDTERTNHGLIGRGILGFITFPKEYSW
jgi:hypothetical protein